MSAAADGMGSVDRALQVLELLHERGSTRVMDVADHLGVARSTAHRVLTALAARQFVIQDAHRLYHRGPALRSLTEASSWGASRLRGLARPHLEALADESGETCHLAVLEGNGARFVDGIESEQLLRVGLRTGLLLPAHVTAVGKVLLADLSHADFFALYPRGLPEARKQLSRRIALEKELATIRRARLATNLDESEQGVTALAVPVVADGRTVASVAVAAPSTRCQRGRRPALVDALRRAAAGMESAAREIGFREVGSEAESPGDPAPGVVRDSTA